METKKGRVLLTLVDKPLAKSLVNSQAMSWCVSPSHSLAAALAWAGWLKHHFRFNSDLNPTPPLPQTHLPLLLLSALFPASPPSMPKLLVLQFNDDTEALSAEVYAYPRGQIL